jgi:trigger factor
LLRVEVDSQAVESEFEKMTSEIQHHAALPGFRTGKVPRPMVEKVYAQKIAEEVKRKMIGDAYKEAVKDQKIDVVGYPDIEEIQFGRGQALQFAATVETAPDFALPEYKGLQIKVPAKTVTDDDLARAMEILRVQRATYLDVDRPAKTGDFVVVNYTGTCEGKSIGEVDPSAQGLAERKNFWLNLEEKETFIPGFAPQMLDAKTGDRRTVVLTFPKDFVQAELAGKEGRFEVEVLQVKERVLPEMNEELAKAYGAENLDKLREGVRGDLEAELRNKRNTEIRNQILRQLLDRVTCELPESVVTAETRNVVYDLVRQNRERGVAKETIEEQKDQIYSFANSNAKERVKVAFLLSKIAEKENLRATREEIGRSITVLAQQYQIPVAKFIRQLEERNGIAEIQERIINEKVFDFLQLNAVIEELHTVPSAP